MYYKFSDYTDMGIVSSDLRAPRSTAKSMGKGGVSVRQVFLLDGDAGHTRVTVMFFFIGLTWLVVAWLVLAVPSAVPSL